MRLNRLVRIGLGVIGVAVLLWIGTKLFGRHDSGPATNVAADGGDVAVRPVSTSGGGAVLVAKEDIPDHAILTADMVTSKDQPGAGSTGPYLHNADTEAVGFITNRPIRKGESLRPDYLLGDIPHLGIAGAVRPGKRAMVVPITGRPTLHDLVRVGNYVDILAAAQGEESRSIVQSVRVLAVDVFGKNYPPVKVAMSGDYKAPAQGIGAANPPTPAGAAPGGTARPVGPNGQPAAAGPTPTPTPPPAPTAAPAPALTLEVTPDQATSLNLAQSMNATLDFLLVSPNEPTLLVAANPLPGATPVAGAGTVPAVYTTRARVFPFAAASKKNVDPTVRTASKSLDKLSTAVTKVYGGSGRRSGSRGGGSVKMPQPGEWGTPVLSNPSGQVPMPVPAPDTYQIPIYADGHLVRSDTVRRPGSPPID